MSPLVGLLQQKAIASLSRIPALVALGHIMAALTGLAHVDVDTPSYLNL